MVRIGGSYFGFAQAFKAVADHYGWTHIVLVTDDETQWVCWYFAKPLDELFSDNKNYTFTLLRLGSEPTDDELDDILQEIQSRTRGFIADVNFHMPFYIFEHNVCMSVNQTRLNVLN